VSGFRALGRALGKTYWHLSYSGIENVPENDGRGLLIASNHQTYLDPYWICLPIYRDFRFMAWDEALDWFLVGRLIRRMGAYPVSLDGTAVSSMKESLRILREGWTLVVFPEGSRTFKDGKLQRFKPGAARLAIQAGVPILPVTIKGGNRVWPRGGYLPHPGKVHVTYHPVIETKDYLAGEDQRERASELTKTLEEVISSAL